MSQIANDDGRFVVVRSDHVSFVIDKPETPYIIGRSRSLPMFQQLQTKYVSREQLSFVWRPPSLFLTAVGKNPVFFGEASEAVPGAGQPVLEFRGVAGADADAAPTLTKAADGHTVVSVPLQDPTTVTTAPPLTQRDAATLFFPADMGLPSIAVRCERTAATAADTREGASAATSTLTAAQMLAVPSLAAGDDNDDEDDEDEDAGPIARASSGIKVGTDGGANEGGEGEKQGWQGLLDAAMQQKHRQEVEARRQQEMAAAAEVARKPVTPPPTGGVAVAAPQPAAPKTTALPPTAPVAAAPKPETIFAPPTAAGAPSAAAPQQAAPPAPEPRMGFWEWKCRANGRDDDPKSWRKYPLAVAKLLEEAYRAKKVTVAVPDTLLGVSGTRGKRGRGADAEEDTMYSVCFAEATLGDGGMIQYQTGDKGKFRVVRRVGGDAVDRHGVKAVRIIPASSSSSDEDSFIDDSDDDSDDTDSSSSESESISSSSDSEDGGKRKRRRRGGK